MRHRPAFRPGDCRAAAILLTSVLIVSCGQEVVPTPMPIPVATSADEFAAAWCASVKAMVRAIGNPDTGSDSQLSAALDAAVEQSDAAEVQRLAGAMTAELSSGRQFAAAAAGWEPGSAAASALDRVLVAFGAMVAAKQAGAAEGLATADARGQSALEQAGGLAAWQAMIGTAQALPPDVVEQLDDCGPWDEAA